MKNFKNIAYILVALISLSMISAGAYAGGISLRIGGFGYGYHHGYHSYGYPAYYSPRYYHHRVPTVTYRHHYRPYYRHHSNSYYSGHGYRNHGYAQYSRQGYHSSHHDRRDNYKSGHGRNRIGNNKRH